MWIEDSIEEYVDEMRCSGVWGGQIEIHALSSAYKVNVLVHQDEPKTWLMENFDASVYPCVQISYHGHCHYNSVRFLDEAHLKKPTLFTLNQLRAKIAGKSSSSEEKDHFIEGKKTQEKLSQLRDLVPEGVSNDFLEKGLKMADGDVYEASAWITENLESFETEEVQIMLMDTHLDETKGVKETDLNREGGEIAHNLEYVIDTEVEAQNEIADGPSDTDSDNEKGSKKRPSKAERRMKMKMKKEDKSLRKLQRQAEIAKKKAGQNRKNENSNNHEQNTGAGNSNIILDRIVNV